MREHRLGAFRMMLNRANAAATRRAQNHRATQAAPRARAQPRGVIEQLIDAGIGEAAELNLRDRPEALRRQADGDARDAGFGDRRIEHARFAVKTE